MKTKSRMIAATAIATMELSSLTPVQQGAAIVAAGALWVSPAMASLGIPGVGVVIKKKPGNAPIIYCASDPSTLREAIRQGIEE